MLRSSLFDYSNAYIVVKGTTSIEKSTEANTNNSDKEVVFKNYALFTDCISEINNTEIDKAKYIDVIMPMSYLIEYGNNYSKTSRGLWQYYRDDKL